jgi:hypothetical protein
MFITRPIHYYVTSRLLFTTFQGDLLSIQRTLSKLLVFNTKQFFQDLYYTGKWKGR